MNRKQRAEIAIATLEIIDRGIYLNPKNESIELSEDLAKAKENSKHYRPEMFKNIFLAVERIVKNNPQKNQTKFEINNETTLKAAQRLIVDLEKKDTICLNFASAKNPGGGFINGSNAQEESLARSSGLYPCINQMQAMYQTNRNLKSCLYTDNIIYSPQVPVFRDDNGNLLDFYYLLSVITSAAVNAGAVLRSKEKISQAEIKNVMSERAKKVLAVAVINNYRNIILGAWGCGVFQNSPRDIAEIFHHHLVKNDYFKNYFDRVVFAILDNSQGSQTIGAFENIFNSPG